MNKIRGKFAPIFSELMFDERWKLECNDRQKFMYLLILYTAYMCNNNAPFDPRYYKVQFALRHRLGTIRADLAHLKCIFPRLLCKDKKLSLLNYRGYEKKVASKRTEKENKNKKEKKKENIIPLHDEILDFWNSHDELPRSYMTKTRAKKLELRLGEKLFHDNWRIVITKLAASDFMTGKKVDSSGRAFRADFSWLIFNDTNYAKVLEGKYDNPVKSKVDEFFAEYGVKA